MGNVSFQKLVGVSASPYGLGSSQRLYKAGLIGLLTGIKRIMFLKGLFILLIAKPFNQPTNLSIL